MRVLALDVGQRRIGLALSDPTGLIATPLGFIQRKGQSYNVDMVLKKAVEKDAGSILVGLPLTPRGQKGSQAREVEAFRQALSQSTDLPVVTWDERFSTQEAERLMRESGRQPSREKGQSDAVAAAVILQTYLDSMRKP